MRESWHTDLAASERKLHEIKGRVMDVRNSSGTVGEPQAKMDSQQAENGQGLSNRAVGPNHCFELSVDSQ